MSKMRWEFIRTLLRWDSLSKNTSETASSRFTPPEIAPSRKDIELLRCDFRSAASPSEAQRLCSPFPEMQSSRIVPLASAPAGCAVPYSTTHDHCGTLKGFSRNISKAALNLAPSVARASPLGDCACPALPAQTPSLVSGEM